MKRHCKAPHKRHRPQEPHQLVIAISPQITIISSLSNLGLGSEPLDTQKEKGTKDRDHTLAVQNLVFPALPGYYWSTLHFFKPTQPFFTHSKLSRTQTCWHKRTNRQASSTNSGVNEVVCAMISHYLCARCFKLPLLRRQ